jgi:hypothetical protein
MKGGVISDFGKRDEMRETRCEKGDTRDVRKKNLFDGGNGLKTTWYIVPGTWYLEKLDFGIWNFKLCQQ